MATDHQDAPVSLETIAAIRTQAEHDDWGGPAKDERSPLSVGNVTDLLSALDAERQRAEQAERAREEATDIVHAVDDAARGQAVSDFLLSFVPVRQVADLKAERDALARENAALTRLCADRDHYAEEVQTLTREVTALREAQAWQPIETANQDEEAVLFTPPPARQQEGE